MKIGVIGAGISGIVAAHTLSKCGHQVTVFEKSTELGGVWALGYPGVKLQNTGYHYRISDIPWPFTPDEHPTSGQIRQYLKHAVSLLKLDIRLEHETVELEEQEDGWLLRYRYQNSGSEERFDFIVVAIGQYTEGKMRPRFPGQENFTGEVITEREINDLDVFDNKSVAIVGFGKSAVDMATFAVQRAKKVKHVFRTPRWLIPFYIFGLHYSRFMFCRAGTIIMPCWEYPTRFERFLHTKLNFLITFIWKALAPVFSFLCMWQGFGKGKEAKRRLRTVLPTHDIVPDLRSASAMAPEKYFQQVADGEILPYHSELSGFSKDGLLLKNGEVISCDQVVLCLGSETPEFPFFPEKYRNLLEAENDGVQLYRHLIHPGIPNVAFAGFNHGFMHVPAAEVGMLWLSAYLSGHLQLPPAKEMEKSIEHILQWKRKHINYEPSRSCAVNTRFQQYIDIVLKELGVSPYRKMPNIFAEIFSQYGAADYEYILSEYKNKRESNNKPIAVLPLNT